MHASAEAKRTAALVAAIVALGWLGLRGERVPLLGWADLGFHELGHLIAYACDLLLPWSEVLTALAGSVLQVAVPLGLATYFSQWRHDRAGTAVCLAWAATSIHDVARYVEDAPYQRLELIGGEHDWAFILAGDLDRAADLAYALRGLGFLLVGLALVAAAWPLLIGEQPAQVVRTGRR